VGLLLDPDPAEPSCCFLRPITNSTFLSLSTTFFVSTLEDQTSALDCVCTLCHEMDILDEHCPGVAGALLHRARCLISASRPPDFGLPGSRRSQGTVAKRSQDKQNKNGVPPSFACATPGMARGIKVPALGSGTMKDPTPSIARSPTEDGPWYSQASLLGEGFQTLS
jgi:hypothetical protein